MKRILLVMIVSLSLSGCATAKNVATLLVANKLGIPAASKEVAAKDEPNRLIARDHSTCGVSIDRWRRVQVGDEVVCSWSGLDSALETARPRAR